MFVFIVVMLFILAFDYAALRFGFDSRDGLESREWERRRQHNWRII